jgi:hypothetical protein
MAKRMNAKIKALWVKALRSGKYKQTRFCLRDEVDDSYCCLGVLCDLYAKEHKDAKWKDDMGDIGFIASKGSNFESRVLPKKVTQWAGINSIGKLNKPHASLIELNDDCKYSFKKIAKVIEEQL